MDVSSPKSLVRANFFPPLKGSIVFSHSMRP